MMETKIIIDAPSKIVKQILLDFKSYHQWNPFILKIQGQPTLGDQIHVDIKLPDQEKINHFDPIVLANNDKQFRWIGQLLCSCCFTGEHYFILNTTTPNQTQFVHGQVFQGCLRPIFFCFAQQKTLRGFESMNKALKQRAQTFSKNRSSK